VLYGGNGIGMVDQFCGPAPWHPADFFSGWLLARCSAFSASERGPRRLHVGSAWSPAAPTVKHHPLPSKYMSAHFDYMSADEVATYSAGGSNLVVTIENVVLVAPCLQLNGRERFTSRVYTRWSTVARGLAHCQQHRERA
jgi:hypothetical protein